MAATATAGTMPLPTANAEEKMDPKRLIAFFAMVFGMFMSILDIQIVSASLAEIQAGLSAGSDEVAWVQTAYLIAEVIMIPLSPVRWPGSFPRGCCFRCRLQASRLPARLRRRPPISTR